MPMAVSPPSSAKLPTTDDGDAVAYETGAMPKTQSTRSNRSRNPTSNSNRSRRTLGNKGNLLNGEPASDDSSEEELHGSSSSKEPEEEDDRENTERIKLWRRSSVRKIQEAHQQAKPPPPQVPPRVVGHESSYPITLLSLMQMQNAQSKERQKNMRPKPSLKMGVGSSAKKKSVKFATNAFSDRVWGFVKLTDHLDDIKFS